ncbi:MAG: helix-turn-helix transcriptional regulator [Clostridia bacterium]|nr:helix-turn-helix transcriptional regulator [Clostridia bacterium]
MPKEYQKLSSAKYFGDREHFYLRKKRARTFALHSHDYFEVELLLDGVGRQRLNGVEYEMKRGSFYLLTPSDFHSVEISEENTVWNLSFDDTMVSKETLEALFSAKNIFIQLSDGEVDRIDRIMSVIAEEGEDRKKVMPLFEYLMEYLLPKAERAESRTPINRAMLFVETYFREAPSLERTAKEVGLSTAYFGNLFKKTVGETYVSYLNRCKINCAKMLLENGKTVTEACFESGFGSLSGFLYTFKKSVGESPEAYRDKQKNAVKPLHFFENML